MKGAPMERKWTETQIAAGYDQQQWGPVPDKDCPTIGTYTYADASGRHTIDVAWIAEGPTGAPELVVAFDADAGGPAMTVLDEATAVGYLIMHGAEKVSGNPDERTA